ncbi:hypothetical protein XENOCAPTIV_021914, partial [Xenoophorus captivus]
IPVNAFTFWFLSVHTPASALQVVIGGRNKYLINGVNANNTRVQDLFCSVGLNVNNPHFLIMQGRITKVLNMKPPEERSSYLEYQKLMREIQHLSRLYVAWLFVCAEETKMKSAENLKVMQDNIAKMQANMAENESKIQELSAQIQELQKKRDQDKKMLVVKEKEVSKLAEQLRAIQEEGQKDSATLEAAEQHFRAVSAGLSTNEDGEEDTLAGQMMACKNDMSKADTEAKQAELKSKQAEVKKMDSGYKKDQDALQAVRSSREKLQAELAKLNYEVISCSNVITGPLFLPRRDPERGWERSKVKGLLANLITVSDVTYATALEVVAGGRLYNIVVDTEVTGKKLLEKGELQRRYTIIPLNKISAKTLNDKVINTAKSLNNVHTALSLVGYEADLRKAMEYVFGSTLVCDTLDNAKKVAFDKQVMTKTVTLGGDIFDPQGTLSGGEKGVAGSVGSVKVI